MLIALGCGDTPSGPGTGNTQPPHEGAYGIYRFDPASGEVSLIYSSDNPLGRVMSNSQGTAVVFREDFGGDEFTDSEICIIGIDGSGFTRLTTNTWLDAYPYWSPDDDQILFLSWPDYPDNTMDIFVMDADGLNAQELYDSGYHDGDCCWVGSKIVFTRQSQVWIMDSDGTGAQQVTDKLEIFCAVAFVIIAIRK